MIDREKEFRNAFYFSKRWANSPLSPGYTRGYSAGNADRKPAKKHMITFWYYKILQLVLRKK